MPSAGLSRSTQYSSRIGRPSRRAARQAEASMSRRQPSSCGVVTMMSLASGKSRTLRLISIARARLSGVPGISTGRSRSLSGRASPRAGAEQDHLQRTRPSDDPLLNERHQAVFGHGPRSPPAPGRRYHTPRTRIISHVLIYRTAGQDHSRCARSHDVPIARRVSTPTSSRRNSAEPRTSEIGSAALIAASAARRKASSVGG
jgi:hypothetical protein